MEPGSHSTAMISPFLFSWGLKSFQLIITKACKSFPVFAKPPPFFPGWTSRHHKPGQGRAS